jgi:DNA-binding transcriptional ArsR family regulator
MAVNHPDTLRDIKLTKRGNEPQKKIDYINDEERVKILHDPVRIQILSILNNGIEDKITTESFDESTGERVIREKIVIRNIMSVHEIMNKAKESEETDELTKNQMYHHLPILVDGNFVIKYGVVTKGGRSTDYYRRTANNFVTYGMHYDPDGFHKTIYQETKDALSLFCFDFTREYHEEFLQLIVKAEKLRLKWVKEVQKKVQSDITESKAVELFDWLLWIYATGDQEYIETIDRIRNLIK